MLQLKFGRNLIKSSRSVMSLNSSTQGALCSGKEPCTLLFQRIVSQGLCPSRGYISNASSPNLDYIRKKQSWIACATSDREPDATGVDASSPLEALKAAVRHDLAFRCNRIPFTPRTSILEGNDCAAVLRGGCQIFSL